MTTDPYEILGVDRTASQEEIRKAYRRLAKELHPDINPGNRAAEERFKQVSGAYDILGDPAKRIRFDRGEIDATGAERPEPQFYREYADAGAAHPYHSTAGFEDFGDVSDLFETFFGGRAGGRRGGTRLKGQDVRYRLALDFLEAVRGARKRVTMPDGRAIDLAVPAGTADGQTLRLKGKGMPGIGGGPAGDALVDIEVRPHAVFSRKGDDILVELPISIDEAVLGGKVAVPTIDGEVTMTLPRGSTSGQMLRLRGKGVRNAARGTRGDQLVTLKVAMPEIIDPELARFMKGWREGHAYDPRRSPRGVS